MEYDVPKFDYNTLVFLRKHTVLGPIALNKIYRARKEAAIIQKYYLEVEHENLGLDTTAADELEYAYRLNAFKTKIMKHWYVYGDGLSLDEFVDLIISRSIKKEDNKVK